MRACRQTQGTGLLIGQRAGAVVSDELGVTPGRHSDGQRIIGIDHHCPCQQIERLSRGVRICGERQRQGSHREIVRIEVFRSLASPALDLGTPDVRQDSSRDPLRHVILESKEITALAVKAVAPDPTLRRGIYEGNDHSQTITDTREPSRQLVARAAVSCEPLQVVPRRA